jgi:hypothetical protein
MRVNLPQDRCTCETPATAYKSVLCQRCLGNLPQIHLYRPLLRPASFCTLPKGLVWDYVEAPANRPDIAAKRGLPISKHAHGIISTDRALTAEEQTNFDLEAQ